MSNKFAESMAQAERLADTVLGMPEDTRRTALAGLLLGLSSYYHRAQALEGNATVRAAIRAYCQIVPFHTLPLVRWRDPDTGAESMGFESVALARDHYADSVLGTSTHRVEL